MRILLTVSYMIYILTNFGDENYTDVNFEVYNQYVAQTASFVIQCLREKTSICAQVSTSNIDNVLFDTFLLLFLRH